MQRRSTARTVHCAWLWFSHSQRADAFLVEVNVCQLGLACITRTRGTRATAALEVARPVQCAPSGQISTILLMAC
jgi:hypothetical protein